MQSDFVASNPSVTWAVDWWLLHIHLCFAVTIKVTGYINMIEYG